MLQFVAGGSFVDLGNNKPHGLLTLRTKMDGAEVAKRNNSKSCCIVLNAEVYDVASYLEQHPGGAAILLAQGGRVCPTEAAPMYDELTWVDRMPRPSSAEYIHPTSCSIYQVAVILAPSTAQQSAHSHRHETN